MEPTEIELKIEQVAKSGTLKGYVIRKGSELPKVLYNKNKEAFNKSIFSKEGDFSGVKAAFPFVRDYVFKTKKQAEKVLNDLKG